MLFAFLTFSQKQEFSCFLGHGYTNIAKLGQLLKKIIAFDI